MQCLGGTCAARCQRAPECGDGFSCDANGYCRAATGQQGDGCASEDACAPGLSCQINGDSTDEHGALLASCTTPNVGSPTGSTCTEDLDCKNGTCALGHCVDLCDETRDCIAGDTCTVIPRAEATTYVGTFQGCLPAHGNLAYPIAIAGPQGRFLLPVPANATSVSLVMSVDDPAQLVGATSVRSPSPNLSTLLSSCSVTDPLACDPTALFFASKIRHRPELAQSVMLIPTNPATPLETGTYDITISSLRPLESGIPVPGSAVPRATAIYKLDASLILDVHFHFLDLDDHPCAAKLGGTSFDAEMAKAATSFQNDFLGQLRAIFAHGGITIGSLSYDDITGHPELDGLDLADAPALLALGHSTSGIDVFFVRTLSPVGIQAIGPNPGPAGLPGTRQSGVAVAVDSLCYRSWEQVARLTAHEIARYMGLAHNVEIELDPKSPTMASYDDGFPDTTDSSTNLMFYSEFGGTDLSPSQSEILQRSPILR